MAELTTIARPYAKAAFQYAQACGKAGEWAKSIDVLAAVVASDNVSAYLDQPQLTAEQQAAALAELCGDALGDDVKNFIVIMAENKRLSVLPEVFVLYSRYLAELEQTEEVNVVSAFELSADEEQQLITTLKKKLGKEVTLQSTVDKSLIGGVVIHAGDLVIDSSVRGKLAKLAETLNS